jgi:hypothetical protein
MVITGNMRAVGLFVSVVKPGNDKRLGHTFGHAAGTLYVAAGNPVLFKADILREGLCLAVPILQQVAAQTEAPAVQVQVSSDGENIGDWNLSADVVRQDYGRND